MSEILGSDSAADGAIPPPGMGGDKALKKAQQNAFDLLVNCLLKRGLFNDTTENLLSDIGEAFQLPFSVEPAHKRTIFKRDENGTPISKTRRRSLRNPQEQDTHREECEVCDKGGDLLCCDNCSLVYHIQCVRFRIETIPDGEWFCPYCLHSKIGDQTTQIALRQMKLIQQICRVSNSSPTEDAFYKAPESTNEELFGLPSLLDDSLIVCRGAGRFVVKKNSRNSSSSQQELSRHWTIEEALQKIKEMSAIEMVKSDGVENIGTSQIPSEDGRHSVWCSQCLDDPRILSCCFCGCKVCFGKHDPTNLLRCDGCEGEYHTYCLDPLEKPSDGPWFCVYCQKNPQLQRSVMLELERQKSSGTTSSSDAGDSQTTRRGRGRPPGSSRIQPRIVVREKEAQTYRPKSTGESAKRPSKSKSTAPTKLEVTFDTSTLETSPLLGNFPNVSHFEDTGKKDKDFQIPAIDLMESGESGTKATVPPLKRRLSSSSVHAQHQPAFAPMNLENTLESFQYILDKGGLRHQLSLRETARIDVATTQYNIFKEMKARDPIRFAQLDQSKYHTVSKKRKAETGTDGDLFEGDENLWNFSDEHDSDDGEIATIDPPPSRSLFGPPVPSLSDGRPFASRFIKPEESMISNRGMIKSQLNEPPRKYANEKNSVPRYTLVGNSSTAAPHSSEATSLSRALTAPPNSKTTKQRGPLVPTDKQRQQRYTQPKQAVSSLHRLPVPSSSSQKTPRSSTSSIGQSSTSVSASSGSGTAPSQSLEDYIRFSMLVSMSQQDAASQSPLASPLPPPAEVDTRYHAGPSFGPHEGLLLSSGNTTANATLLPMNVPARGNVVLPSPTGISPSGSSPLSSTSHSQTTNPPPCPPPATGKS